MQILEEQFSRARRATVLGRFARVQILVLSILLLCGIECISQPTPSQPVNSPTAAQPAFDAKAATDAYLNVPAEQHARSDAYFEGGYWMILWDFVLGAAICLVLLNTRLSARMRDFAEGFTRFRPLQTALYWVEYLIVTTVMIYPLNVYEGFLRERKYELMNQSFGAWSVDDLKNDLINLILGAILVVVLFAIVRRLSRTWWIWGAVVAVAFLMFTALITPVYLAPLFNKYTKLHDERIRGPILAMARANGIPATDIWVVDASRQSKRVSANVSGFLGTERITLNDNLLNRCSLPEIEAVMGHEMGHYVMNHIYKDILFFMLMALLFFGFLRWSLGWALARWGEKWQVRRLGDPAVLPLVILLGSAFFFVMTPVSNSWTRTQEYEADMFGLNASGQPDGEAKVDVMLGEYRKLDPSRLEEIVFFDHPSGRTRITAAMRWKAEHLK